jgi:hypothetical protein
VYRLFCEGKADGGVSKKRGAWTVWVLLGNKEEPRAASSLSSHAIEAAMSCPREWKTVCRHVKSVHCKVCQQTERQPWIGTHYLCIRSAFVNPGPVLACFVDAESGSWLAARLPWTSLAYGCEFEVGP